MWQCVAVYLTVWYSVTVTLYDYVRDCICDNMYSVMASRSATMVASRGTAEM